MPADIILGTAMPTPTTVPQYVVNLRNSLETAYQYVRCQMGHKQEKQKISLQCQNSQQGLRCWRSGLVAHSSNTTWKVEKSVYRLQHIQAPRKLVVVHFDWLKLCYPGTRQPEMREHPRRPPQSPLGVPVGTGLELVDDDSGEAHFTGRRSRPQDLFCHQEVNPLLRRPLLPLELMTRHLTPQ